MQDADQRARTALLVAWLTERVFGARSANAAVRAVPPAHDAARPEAPPEVG